MHKNKLSPPQSHEDVVQVGLSCLAFMTLRNACETAQFLIANGVTVLSEIMNFGSNNIQILVSRRKEKAFCSNPLGHFLFLSLSLSSPLY